MECLVGYSSLEGKHHAIWGPRHRANTLDVKSDEPKSFMILVLVVKEMHNGQPIFIGLEN